MAGTKTTITAYGGRKTDLTEKKKREKTINKGEECNIYGGWTVEQPGKGEGWMH